MAETTSGGGPNAVRLVVMVGDGIGPDIAGTGARQPGIADRLGGTLSTAAFADAVSARLAETAQGR